jgi:hypothetical protein
MENGRIEMNGVNVISVFVCMFLIGVPLTSSGKEPSKRKSAITLNEAKNIANQELKKYGFNPEEMRIEADENNTVWHEHVSEDPSILQEDIIREMKLEAKVYWAIYYAPREEVLGGDALVFIDAKNGTVIGVVLME